jgi:hypothetical protein
MNTNIARKLLAALLCGGLLASAGAVQARGGDWEDDDRSASARVTANRSFITTITSRRGAPTATAAHQRW